MEVTVSQIDLWRQVKRENPQLEFKEAKNQFDFDRLCRYCVALANEKGGHLVLGIANSVPRAVVGTRAFPDLSVTAEKLFRKLGFRVDVGEVLHPGGRVIVFQIPSRPSGSAYHLDGTYLMRNGEELVPMSEDQLRKIFAEGEPDWLEGFSARDVDSQGCIDMLDTQTFFELFHEPYPTRQEGVLERLVAERLIADFGGTYGIRRLGALLLAKNLDDFPDLARKAPRVVVYSGATKLETKLDYVHKRGYAVGFRGVVQFIMQQLPQNEIFKDVLRSETKLLSDVAVRELVANALIHQDFSINGGAAMFEIYSNRVVFSSPGDPLMPVDRLIDGYQTRNERLAAFMRRVGICEEKGSGIDRVIAEAELYQLPAPDFRAAFKRTEVILFGPKLFDDMDRDDRVRACYQHCVLKYVFCERMTNQSLRARFRLPSSKSSIVSQVISQSVADGKIKPDASKGGSKKFANYLPFWA